MSGEPVVLTEVRGRVLLVTLNRPEARNAVTREVAAELAAALDRLDGDDDLGAGVITGAGRGFCAGMDLKAFAAGAFPTVPGRGFGGITERSARKPLVAAVEGFALAGGLEIALACDIIVASATARLGLPEAAIGLFAAAGGLWRLPRRVGLGAAMTMALTGAPVTGEEGHRIGLVDRLTEPGGALEGAMALAETIAANAPLAVATTKAVALGGFTRSADEFWEWQKQFHEGVFASKDALEGARAFIEKRKAQWRGE